MKTADIAQLLSNVYDPELGIDIVSLGMLYGIRVGERHIEIVLTTTSADCPMGGAILEGAETYLRSKTSGYEVNVNPSYEPPWAPEMMDDAARRQLGLPPRVKASA
jgi:metal-sulfur cluster biosynthetic enzyme